ncbi:hypothetical protein [Streptomyces aidingensis]|uniref:hypothetical protein n=1 Tax=Streptomyces aidingensis TaxID=910347 RepID=UPI001FE3D05C|nr:hypothetical protein [Streptomyces aidingensis]
MSGPALRPGHPAATAANRTLPEAPLIRTTPATAAEVDAWITVLHDRGHLHRAVPGPAGTWTVQRTADSRPRTLHHPVLAMDFVAELLLELRSRDAEPPR